MGDHPEEARGGPPAAVGVTAVVVGPTAAQPPPGLQIPVGVSGVEAALYTAAAVVTALLMFADGILAIPLRIAQVLYALPIFLTVAAVVYHSVQHGFVIQDLVDELNVAKTHLRAIENDQEDPTLRRVCLCAECWPRKPQRI